jgi:hypothetical protein
MKTSMVTALLLFTFMNQLSAQKACVSFAYQQQQISKDPSLQQRIEVIENFTRQNINNSDNQFLRTEESAVIIIPVVVHILYHYPEQNISDERIFSQIAALNRDFRRMAADTINTPARFKALAADCKIEFKLATSDPRKRNTTGIVRKYTPVLDWEADDKVKYSAEMGDDAWDSKSYLNIWVCNLNDVAGYSSVMGGPAEKDGIVVGFNVFGTINTMTGYNTGRTAVHEVGHWLSLRHLWGDVDCGDDGVSDTPKQSIYTVGCPAGIRITCNNGPNGNMYMNYMDFTDDVCMNMFSLGQKERMRALFAPGGVRSSLLVSTGLNPPLIFESPLPEEDPRWLHPQLFPNPANVEMTLDLSYDTRWIGKLVTVFNQQGQIVHQVTITAKLQKIDITRLKPGMYFLVAKKEDGETIKQKFIKL